MEKLKNELGANPSAAEKEALAKKHTEELAELQRKLVEQHEKDLKATVDAAIETAKKEAPAVPVEFDKQAIINTAIAEYEAKIKAQHEADIESAVERGRREQMTKGKLKDAQLAKAQKRVKDFEAQILEWKNTGVLPQDAAVIPIPATPIATASTTPAVPSTIPAPPTASAPASSTPSVSTVPATQVTTTTSTSSTQPATNALPRKPTTNTGTAPPVGRGGAPLRARGGVPLGRGAAARVPPVRGSPAQQAAAAAAVPPTAGVSIMGAANKRPREEGAAPADDSLAKRLKPADGASKGPVQIRRPPPGP